MTRKILPKRITFGQQRRFSLHQTPSAQTTTHVCLDDKSRVPLYSHYLHLEYVSQTIVPCIRNYLYRDKGSLGSAYPRTNAVDAEPLSASQLKVIHQSTCYYHQDLYCCKL